MMRPTQPTRCVSTMWPSPYTRPLDGLHVLIADDAAPILLAYGDILRRAGATVVTADDGTAAVAAFEEAGRTDEPFDAAVLDYAMPGLNGAETAARLRASGFDGAIVGVSAEITGEDEERWFAAGCDRVVCKGLPAEELVAAVATACGRGV